MANKNPHKLPPKWKKGESGNPSGRPKDPPGLKRLKNLSREELVEVGNLVIKGNLDALRLVARDKDATALKTMIAAVCVKVIERGDMQSLDILLNRLIGKVKDEVEVSGANGEPLIALTMPANGREAPPEKLE